MITIRGIPINQPVLHQNLKMMFEPSPHVFSDAGPLERSSVDFHRETRRTNPFIAVRGWCQAPSFGFRSLNVA